MTSTFLLGTTKKTRIFFKLSEELGCPYRCTHLQSCSVSVLLGTWLHIFVADQIELVDKPVFICLSTFHLQSGT